MSKRELRKTWRNAYASIEEMTGPLFSDETTDEGREKAEQAIQEDALSVEVRSGWVSPGSDMPAEEFCLLLATGGPAVRIIGELASGEPSAARLEVQDWFEPWTEFPGANEAVLLAYCRCFYFGEG